MQISKSIATLAGDLLELPFLCELLIQSLQLLNQVSTSSDDGVFGCQGSIGLDAQFKGCEQRVRDFVGGEQNVWRLCEFGAEEIGESVIFLVEGEDCCVRNTCAIKPVRGEGQVAQRREGNLRVSGAQVTFFSPSPRRKSSNLVGTSLVTLSWSALWTERVVTGVPMKW
jgi:hypothetical protein